MNFLEIRMKVEGYIKDKIILDDNIEKEIKDNMSIIMDQIECAMKGEPTTTLDPDPIILFISALHDFFLTSPLTNKICDFLLLVTEIIYNWNANSINDKRISVFILSLNRLVEIRQKMTLSITVMKDIYERYMDLVNWQPPVFDLAVNYFDKLLEENEKGNKVEDKVQSCGT